MSPTLQKKSLALSSLGGEKKRRERILHGDLVKKKGTSMLHHEIRKKPSTSIGEACLERRCAYHGGKPAFITGLERSGMLPLHRNEALSLS